jgi:Holliday junction DNA helicase RuvA
MIATVTGIVATVTADGAVIEVGGIGVSVLCTPATTVALRVGEHARLWTSLVVREDSLTLFGFATADEREVFEILQGVTGVGPRLAQAVLAAHAPDAVRAAVATDNIAALMLVAGVGRKSAQRLVLELKDKLGMPTGSTTVVRLPGQPGPTAWRDQLRDALVGLGWSGREVEGALTSVGPEAEAAIAVGDVPDIAALLRSSLQQLSRA